MSVVTLTPDFGWVVLVCVGSVVLLQYLGARVGMARKKYNVPVGVPYKTGIAIYYNVPEGTPYSYI